MDKVIFMKRLRDVKCTIPYDYNYYEILVVIVCIGIQILDVLQDDDCLNCFNVVADDIKLLIGNPLIDCDWIARIYNILDGR